MEGAFNWMFIESVFFFLSCMYGSIILNGNNWTHESMTHLFPHGNNCQSVFVSSCWLVLIIFYYHSIINGFPWTFFLQLASLGYLTLTQLFGVCLFYNWFLFLFPFILLLIIWNCKFLHASFACVLRNWIPLIYRL